MGTGVAVDHPNLDGLVDFTEGGVQAGLNSFLSGIARAWLKAVQAVKQRLISVRTADL